MAALVARPSVPDTALEVELGFLGEEQDAAAAWAIRPAGSVVGVGWHAVSTRIVEFSSTARHPLPDG